MTSIEFSIVYEPVENGWTQARIAELPAVITTAPTKAQARELVVDALSEYLRSLRSEPAAPSSEGERESLSLLISS